MTEAGLTKDGERCTQLRRQIIQWTGNALAALLKHVSVNHRGRHVGVTQQLLNRANVRASLEEVRCKGVPEGLGTYDLGQECPPGSNFDGLINHRRIDVVPPDDAGQWIGGDIPGGKEVLPAPFPG